MPDRYGLAVCATELRLRHEILEKYAIKIGGPPNRARFPARKEGKGGERGAANASGADTSSVCSTSVTSTASHLRGEVDIADLHDNVIDKDGPNGYVRKGNSEKGDTAAGHHFRYPMTPIVGVYFSNWIAFGFKSLKSTYFF